MLCVPQTHSGARVIGLAHDGILRAGSASAEVANSGGIHEALEEESLHGVYLSMGEALFCT